ncbi:MAG: spore germination protein [Christensenellales bacterium]|jgi:spore germination protein KA
MRGFFIRKLNYLMQKSQVESKAQKELTEPDPPLSTSLQQNIEGFKIALSNSNDLVVREFSFGKRLSVKAAVLFIDGLASLEIINSSIIEPLMYKTSFLEMPGVIVDNSIAKIKEAMIASGDVQETGTMNGMLNACLSGDTVLLINGADIGIIISTKGYEKRAVNEPATESVVRGPREAFTENLRTNTSLLRRKIRTPNLTTEMLTLGRRTRTSVCLVYIKGLASEDLLKTVKERLDSINTDAILESGYIEEYIEDSLLSIFPTMNPSEKPDVVAGRLLEGRVALIIDGSPFVITAPMLFVETFQSAEDYYSRPYLASFLRLIRYIGFFITILSPAIYVALSTFHQELIPTNLLISMAAAREGVPFPAVVEALVMGLVFEVLREAGIRLPRPVGQAISIVGALVMGESAVAAGLIGAPMVIVVALTAVSSFIVPYLEGAALILRLTMLILAATLGGFGITLGILATLMYLASLESFGVPYFSPMAPFRPSGIKDTFMRAPLWQMISRPEGLAPENRQRQHIGVPKTINPDAEDDAYDMDERQNSQNDETN